DKIIVSAGEVGRSIRLNPKELATFVQAEFAEIREI
ncbi:MAG: aminoacyl-tRNA deacylase, partial [Lactococcus sp.]